MKVFKFGGTSVGSVAALRLATEHVHKAAPEVTVVVSAMNGITDLLLNGVKQAAVGEDIHPAAEAYRARYMDIIDAFSLPAPLRAEVNAFADEYIAMGRSVAILRELSTRTLDAAAARGERMLARIFAALLEERGLKVDYADAAEVIFTERRGGALWPDFARSSKALRAVRKKGRVLVIPGFIARGPDGETVTLGRGGSDFSAAIVAHCLGASEVVLYKEVDGLLTADPKWVPAARVLPELHYREAAELAYYGAKVLHPRTMIPLVPKGIPLSIKNTFHRAAAGHKDSAGTRISGKPAPSDFPVKALTAVNDQALVAIAGNGMIGVPGVAGRAFTALSSAGHSVSMISQASSESSICFVVPAIEAKDAVRALREAFALELSSGLIDAVEARREIALVAVVGLGMAGTPGIAARVFSALSREHINIVAIAQGSSELNITVVVEQKQAREAVQALHREFQLDKIRPLASNDGRDATLALLGYGQIGRALAAQLGAQTRYFSNDLGIIVRCVGVADRKGLVLDEAGFSPEAMDTLSARKVAGKSLGRAVALERLWSIPARRPILVDVTADETFPVLQQAVIHGFHVVVANKKPLAVPQKDFDALFAAAREHGLHVRYEATVGAGLPVLDTFRKLHDAGDRIGIVLGCFSGTLGYLMSQLEAGVPFSRAVAEAHRLGYTEPDPREDLSGLDVGRKALILARTLGRKLDMKDVEVEPLFPAALGSADPVLFVKKLAALDADYAKRLVGARKKKKVLRYVARIGTRGVRVGLEEVPESSPMGRLRGTDNQVAIYTKRYKTNPLVVTGPGAGADVTAAGVLNDIVSIASGA